MSDISGSVFPIELIGSHDALNVLTDAKTTKLKIGFNINLSATIFPKITDTHVNIYESPLLDIVRVSVNKKRIFCLAAHLDLLNCKKL